MFALITIGTLTLGSLLMFVGMVIAASSRNVEEKRRSIGLSIALIGTMVMLAGVVVLFVQNFLPRISLPFNLPF